jgi:deferrochelatase/peroxidase EfeB
MSDDSDHGAGPSAGGDQSGRLSRRSFLGAAGAAVGGGVLAKGIPARLPDAPARGDPAHHGIEGFYGLHQGGVITPAQGHTYFVALDLLATTRKELATVMRSWTEEAARLTTGRTALPLSSDAALPAPDSGEAIGLGPARLTINFGFGPGIFGANGVDRFGLAPRRPEALVDLPQFPGDLLEPARTGGDLTIQACADDPQVAFHAVRQLLRAAGGTCALRWAQAGFNESAGSGGATPRNLMGFKDGTINPRTQAQLEGYVWVGPEGPAWMTGGTYLVARRIRIFLQHWDQRPLELQEGVIGRHKVSGAPLGAGKEFDPLDLNAKDSAGELFIPAEAHVRLAAPQRYGGQMILRRSYSFNDGADPFVEFWPPYKEALMYDAGLFFQSYQRDPRKGFIQIFTDLAVDDALRDFTAHTGSVLVAIPPAAAGPGDYVGRELLEG